MAWKRMKSLPLGPVILCYPNGPDEYDVTEANIISNRDGSKYINVLTMESHGCGCCGGGNPNPIAWDHRPRPPKWLGETNG